jgi:hypothetical protein
MTEEKMKFRIIAVTDAYDPIGKMYHRHFEIERCITILGKEKWFAIKQVLGDENMTFNEPITFQTIDEARRYVEDTYGKTKESRTVVEIIDARFENDKRI